MTDEEFDKLLKKCSRIVFPNGETDFSKVLWRLSKGNRQEAFYIVKLTLYGYHIELTDELFDMLCADINDGLDVEWLEWDWPEIIEDKTDPRYRYGAAYTRQKQLEELEKVDNFFKNRITEIS